MSPLAGPAWIRQVRQRSSIQDDQPLGLPGFHGGEQQEELNTQSPHT